MAGLEPSWAKGLIVAGLLLCTLGVLALLLNKWGITLGRLPGDLHVEGDRGSFHFPWVTSLLLSALATLLLNWLSKR